MKTISSLLSVVALAAAARAGGIIDNTAEAAKLAAAASQLTGAGNYVFTNVKTGQTLSFTRSDSTTDFYPQDSADSVAVQFSNGAARISGGNNKCASAQWSYDVEGGVDYAAVSYACAVGSGELTGTATLEKTKQWWYLVPAGSTSSSDDFGDDDEDSDDSSNDSDSGISVSIGLQFNAKNSRVAAAKVASTSSDSSSASSSSASSSTTSSAASSSSTSDISDKQAEYNKLGYWTSESSSVSREGVDVSRVDKNDRSTWFCQHPGWWLANHPAYVTKAGHVECASDLKAYLADQSSSRMVKRAGRPSHSQMAKKLAKKGQQTYNIIAVDHILNMATRAIDSSALSTYGGYTSTTLSLWDANDEGQQWTITAASDL
ncbi:hypothetical protein JCM8547_000231 [Rhodosporidiobolus lusitaniae]